MAHTGRTEIKRALQDRQRQWLRNIMAATGKKPSQIAEVANVSDTTLTRILNNPDYQGTLSQITIDRIAAVFNVVGPEEAQKAGNTMLLAEAERLDPQKETGELARIVNAMLDGRDTIEAWRLRGMALENAGYLQGDVLFVDVAAQPRPHDAVCAQVADYRHGAAETVFRIYDPPYLVAAPRERLGLKTLVVDGERVQLRGVVVHSFRPNRLSAI